MNGLAHPLQRLGRSIEPEALARGARRLASVASSPSGAVAIAALAFIAISYWWLTQDDRVTDSATGNHLLVSLDYYDQVRSGDLLAPFTDFNIYPPLVHLVGTISFLIGGVTIAGPILAQNLLFVPLLAVGCYGAGSVAYGRTAGMLAALFALGTPMLISQFHVFMLDAPLAAITAAEVWLLLASDRLSRPGYSAAAGAFFGLGMLTKNSFVFFVGGLLLVMLARGGWRNWRNIAVFAFLAGVIATPWYLDHAALLRLYTGGAVNEVVNANPGPARWSLKNFLWYGDSIFEHQLYLPLTIFFAFGVLAAVRRWLRERAAFDYTPELIAGGLVGYLAITLLSVKDPRYGLPCLVYMSVLGTGWLVRKNDGLRLMPAAALLVVLLVNVLTVDFGLGGSARIGLPGGWRSGGLAAEMTIIGPPTFLEGRAEPRQDSVRQLLRAAKRDGAQQIYLAGGLDDWRAFNSNGLTILSRLVGLRAPAENDPTRLRRRDFFLVRSAVPLGRSPACLRLRDGSGVYLGRGGANPHLQKPHEWRLFCPSGHP